MSTCSRKINEIIERLDGVSGYSDYYLFMELIKISLIIYRMERYVNDCENYYKELFKESDN